VTIRLEILPVKFVLYNKKVEMAMGVGVGEPIKSLDRTVRLSVCSENRKSLGCLERFDYYITTWFAKKHSVRRSSNGPQTGDADRPGLAKRSSIRRRSNWPRELAGRLSVRRRSDGRLPNE
jgi:hypothetical protein